MTVQLHLDNITRLATYFGNPQEQVPRYIHIAGINGKTSVALILARLLHLSALRVGTFVHPPLGSPRTSILIDESPLEERHFQDLWKNVNRADSIFGTNCSQYEKLFLTALLAFRDHGCHLLVIESALGGTFDATNLLGRIEIPGGLLAAVITTITRDHIKYLGEEIADITKNILGIYRVGAFISIAANQPDTVLSVVNANVESHLATTRQSSKQNITAIEKEFIFTMPPEQQIYNIELALRTYHQVRPALNELYGDCCPIDLPMSIFVNLIIPQSARQFYFDGHRIVVDAAQNDASPILNWIAGLEGPTNFVMGFSEKNEEVIKEVLNRMHLKDTSVCSIVPFRPVIGYEWIHPLKSEHLGRLLSDVGINRQVIEYSDLTTALKEIREELIVVLGSQYIVHDFYQDFCRPKDATASDRI